MDKITENIIAIRQRDISRANEAFADFMSLTEKCLNDKVAGNRELYKDCGGRKMEEVALGALHEVAPQTPFRPEEIKLVSGARFPDIQAERYYGVEVKTTQRNSWKSVGSSIIESTRIEDISMIYMLFAKLGGDFAEFRCKPYEDCLDNVSLTHQPRYQIDMELDGRKKKTIFQKMKIDYHDFCQYEDKKKIAKVQEYIRSGHKKGTEMQWWIGGDDDSRSIPMTIRFLNDLGRKEKELYRARMFVIFPELFGTSPTKFKKASLWLCSRNSLLCSNVRDFFTAGGRVKSIGKKHFDTPVPRIAKRLYGSKDTVREMLRHPDDILMEDINEFWSLKVPSTDYETTWMTMMQTTFKQNPELSEISLEDLMENW